MCRGYLVTMRWYARPEGDKQQLRVTPRLASWNKADDPDQVRLQAFLDDTEALLADQRVDGPWALRLDVGLPTGRNLLDMADLETDSAADYDDEDWRSADAYGVRLRLSLRRGPIGRAPCGSPDPLGDIPELVLRGGSTRGLG